MARHEDRAETAETARQSSNGAKTELKSHVYAQYIVLADLRRCRSQKA